MLTVGAFSLRSGPYTNIKMISENRKLIFGHKKVCVRALNGDRYVSQFFIGIASAIGQSRPAHSPCPCSGIERILMTWWKNIVHIMFKSSFPLQMLYRNNLHRISNKFQCAWRAYANRYKKRTLKTSQKLVGSTNNYPTVMSRWDSITNEAGTDEIDRTIVQDIDGYTNI